MKTLFVLLFPLLCLLFSPAAAQSYEPVPSVDALDGEECILASGPVLEEALVMGEIEENKLMGVSYSEDCVRWRFEHLKKGFRIQRVDKPGVYLGLNSSNKLKAGTPDDYWEITPVDTGAQGQFMLKHIKSTNDGYALVFRSGTDYAGYYALSTPGNTPLFLFRRSALPPVPSPVFATAEERFDEGIDVVLTAPEGCRIYYTTDGTRPVPGSAAEYSGPIRLAETTTVQAVAAAADGRCSEVVSRRFECVTPVAVRLGGKSLVGTFFSPYEMRLPEGAAAFTIAGLDAAGVLRLERYEPAGGVLPALVPFILQGAAGQTELELRYAGSDGTMAPEYDRLLAFGTTGERPLPTDSLIFALGYDEVSGAFGFCRYTGEVLPASRAFLRLALPYMVQKAGPAPGETWTGCILATEVSPDGAPAGIAWGELGPKDNGGITPVDMAAGEKPVEWTLSTVKAGTRFDCGNVRLGLAGKDDLNLVDVRRVNDGHENWQLTVEEGIGRMRICTVDKVGGGNRPICYSSHFGNIKCYNTTEELFYLFRPAAGATAAAPRFLSLPGSVPQGVERPSLQPDRDAPAHDLSGRRIGGTPRGLFIQGGRVHFRP